MKLNIRNKKSIIKLLILIVSVYVILCTIFFRDWKKPLSNIHKIENDTNLTLPDNSRVTHFKSFLLQFVEPHWIAKVVIPNESYESFKETLLEKPSVNFTTNGNRITDSIDWWKPMDVVLTKLYWADPHTLVEVIVSKDNDGEVSVYIDCIVP